MRFLCDVHISFKIVNFLSSYGFETVHVNGILDRWNTKDTEICRYADENNFIVITKDTDFRNSFLLKQTPKRLIKINLGNISTEALIEILAENIEAIKKLDAKPIYMIEVDRQRVTFHL